MLAETMKLRFPYHLWHNIQLWEMYSTFTKLTKSSGTVLSVDDYGVHLNAEKSDIGVYP